MDLTPPAARPVARRHSALVTITVFLAVVALVVGATALYFHYHAAPKRSAVVSRYNPQAAYDNDSFGLALSQISIAFKSYTKPVSNSTYISILVLKSQTLSQEGYLTFTETTYGPQAAAVAQQAIQLDATSSEAYRVLGFANEVQQKYTDAHTAYEKAIQLDSQNALALAGDAHVYELQGDGVKAKTGYLAALAADANCYPADLGLGRIASASGDTDGALTYFQEVYGYSPNVHDKAEAAYSLGMIYLSGKQDDLARGYLEKAISLDATYFFPRFGYGIALYAQATRDSTTADAKSSLLAASANSLALAGAYLPEGTHPQFLEDLYVVGDNTLALAALSSAAAAIPADATFPQSGKSLILKNLDAITSLVKKGPPPLATK